MSYARGLAFSRLADSAGTIGQTIQGLRRQKEDDALAREQLDYQRRLQLLDRGGELGPVPQTTTTLGGFDAPAFIPEPTGTAFEQFGEVPDFAAEPPPRTISAPDPDFMAVGPGYIERPGVRENRERDRLAGAYGAVLGPGTDPETARALGTILAAGGATQGLIPGSRTSPRRTGFTRSGDRNVLVDLDSGEPIREFEPMPSSEPRMTGLPTYAQALEEFKNEYGTWTLGPDGQWSQTFSLPPERLSAMATARARGERVPSAQEIRTVDADVPGAMAGYPQSTIDRVSRQRAEQMGVPEPDMALPGGGRASGPGPSAGPPRPTLSGPSDEEVQTAAQAIAGLPPEQQREILLAEGATPEQLRRFLGGG